MKSSDFEKLSRFLLVKMWFLIDCSYDGIQAELRLLKVLFKLRMLSSVEIVFVRENLTPSLGEHHVLTP